MDDNNSGLFVRICNLMLMALAIDELKESFSGNQFLIMIKNAIFSNQVKDGPFHRLKELHLDVVI